MGRHHADMSPNEIRKRMIDANITQTELARRGNVSQQMIYRVIEGDGVSDRIRELIAEALNMDKKSIWLSIILNDGPRKPGRPRSGRVAAH